MKSITPEYRQKAIDYLRTYLDGDEYNEDTTDRLIEAVTSYASCQDEFNMRLAITALFLFEVEGET